MQNQIPKNWQKVKLGDILAESPQYGYTASSTKSKLGPKLLRITDIQDDFVDWENVPYCEISEKEKSKYLLEKGDIVFARTGNTTGANFYLNNIPREEVVFASYLIRVRPDKKQCLPEYLAYFFRSHSYWGQVKNLLSGSAQPGINASNLQNFTFDLPEDIETQKEIASILSAFDDKIEVNNKIAKTLEEMAQTLFKEWFVKFKFPDYKKVEFIDSKLGKIPKGWEVGTIGDLVQIISGYPFPSNLYTLDKDALGVVTIKNVQDGNFIRDYDSFIRKENLPSNFNSDCILKDGDILLSLTGNVGRVCFVHGGEYLLNQRVAKLKPTNRNDLAFCYLLFRQISFRNYLINMAKGSAQPNLSPVEVSRTPLVIPSRKIFDSFNLVVGPIYQQLVKNTNENQKLAALRDLLLPKLMRGEVKI